MKISISYRADSRLLCLPVLQSRVVHSEKLSKSKPFGILRFALAGDAGIKLQPSVLLIFGNPLLGTQFITANANAGVDWPVRLLVYENDKGEVWTAYTDFDWIARRHGIKNRQDQFKMASSVIATITSSVRAK
jgi:uncharacterized protein DUF302